jgi:hypothetical protein
MSDRNYQQIPNARTGRRPVLAKAEPRNKTVCFTLSETEKLNLDKLCMSMNSTRSALISHLLVEFVDSAMSGGDLAGIMELFEKASTDHEKYGEQTNKIVDKK